MASEAISECLIISWGSMPPDPPTLFTLTRTQWPYQFAKKAGFDPEFLRSPITLDAGGNAIWLLPRIVFHSPFHDFISVLGGPGSIERSLAIRTAVAARADTNGQPHSLYW